MHASVQRPPCWLVAPILHLPSRVPTGASAILFLVLHSHHVCASTECFQVMVQSQIKHPCLSPVVQSAAALFCIHASFFVQSPSMGVSGSKTSIAQRPGWKPAAGMLHFLANKSMYALLKFDVAWQQQVLRTKSYTSAAPCQYSHPLVLRLSTMRYDLCCQDTLDDLYAE